MIADLLDRLQVFSLIFWIYFVIKHTSGSALRLIHMARTDSVLFQTITRNSLTLYRFNHLRAMLATSFGQLQGFLLKF